MGTLKDPSELLTYAEAIYNNLVTSEQWNYNTSKDNSILAALKTELKILKTAILQSSISGNSSSNTSSSRNVPHIAEWCYSKLTGQDSVQRDGKNFHWCPKHKGKNGDLTGLYVTHKAEDHDVCVANKSSFNSSKRNKNKSASSDGNGIGNQGSSQQGQQLQLDPHLKSALCTGSMVDSLADDASVN